MYEIEILELYKRCGIRSFPVDVDRILQEFGYEIMTYEEATGNDAALHKVFMTISMDGFTIRNPKRMYVNERSYIRRQLFTKAHEIGHIALASDDEEVANEFAANLLAPRPVIFAKRLQTASKISEVFGISVAAANHALLDSYYHPDQDALRVINYFGLRQICPWPFNQTALDDIDETPEPWIKPKTPDPSIVRLNASEAAPDDGMNNNPEQAAHEAADAEMEAQKAIQLKLYEKKKKNKIKSLERTCVRLREKIRMIDPLSEGWEADYKRYQKELWDAERRLERMTDTVPVRDLEFAWGYGEHSR